MRACVLALAALLSLSLAGCWNGDEPPPYRTTAGGNPRQGAVVIASYGCGACHVIPGIHAAQGMVGPPLLYMSRRTMIAGEVPNTPENMIRWIKDPQSVEPGTAMPKLGLTDQQARDVAAYLYTLR
jgi:cytochrome c1